MSRSNVFLVLLVSGLAVSSAYGYKQVLGSGVEASSTPEAAVQKDSLPPMPPVILGNHENEKYRGGILVLKTLDEQLKDNREAVVEKERELKDSHAIERLNSRRLSALESRRFYEMIDAVARLRAQGIELRLQRLQARIERGQ